MTHKKTRSAGLHLFFALVAAATIMNGCAGMDQILQKPAVTFDRMRITDADLMQSTAVFNFKVSNPNPIGIWASGITYDLKLNGRKLVGGNLDKGFTLGAASTSTVSIPVVIQYLDFYESISQLWQAKGADYTLTGGVDIGPFTIPFQAHGSFELPRMPKLSLENIQVDQISFSGAALNCRLKMDNPNRYNLAFKRIDYDLKLGNTSFARASAQPKGPIAGNSSSMVNLGFKVSFAQMGRSAYELLQGSNSRYQLDGRMVFESPSGKERSVPFSSVGRVPFSR